MASMTPDASGNKPPEAAMQSIEPVQVPEAAERVWVTILEIQEDDWGIGGRTDWLRDYESALNTLGPELKPRL